MSEPIPQASPGSVFAERSDEIEAAIRRVIRSGTYILGPEVTAFEAEFAAYLGVGHGVGVANGTDAIELALRAVGIGAGDAVFTVSHTAVATVAAIERCGATPVLVDIDPVRFTLDPASLKEAVAETIVLGELRPAAVVPVHLYGGMADMPTIVEIARGANLKVVEDCAQAHGARLAGQLAGTWGDVASFSFYPTKNLAAVGDGGLVATNDPAVASRVRELRQYGWDDSRISREPGLNSRLDEMQAAILRVGLGHLNRDNERRAAIAQRYGECELPGIAVPDIPPNVGHVFHQFVIRVSARDSLRAALRAQGIGTAIHYPLAIHQQPAYAACRTPAGGLPATDRIVTEIVSLPMFPTLGLDSVERVCDALTAWLATSESVAAR